MTVRYQNDTEPASADDPAATPDTEARPGPREALGKYAELGGFTLAADSHPWYPADEAVGSPEDARAASTVLAELRSRDVLATRAAVTALIAPGGLDEPDSVIALGLVIGVLRRVQGTSAKLRPEAYEADLAALTAATAGSRWRKEQGVKLSWSRRRALRAQARQLAAGGRARRADLHDALAAAAAERADWTALAASADADPRRVRPVVPADADRLTAAAQAVEALAEAVRALGRLLPGRDLETAPLGELADLVDRLAADEGTLYRLPTLRALRAELAAAGLTDLFDELAERQADREAALAAYDRHTGAADTEDGGLEAARQVLAAGPRTETDPGAEEAPAAEPEIPAARPETVIEAEVAAEVAEVEAEVAVEAAEVEAEAEVAEVEAEVAVEAAEVEAEVAEVEAEVAVEAAEVEAEAEAAEVEAEVAAEVAEVEAEVAVEAAEVEAVEVEVEIAAESESVIETAAEAEAVAEAEPVVEAETVAASDAEPVAEPVAEGVAAVEAAPEQERPKRVRRPRKPSLTAGQPITAYTPGELRSLVRWIDGDGVERTEDDLLRAAMKELGFARLGPRIKEALGAAVSEVRG